MHRIGFRFLERSVVVDEATSSSYWDSSPRPRQPSVLAFGGGDGGDGVLQNEQLLIRIFDLLQHLSQ